MKAFTWHLSELNEYQETLDALRQQNTPVHVTGCIDSQKSNFVYAVMEKAAKKRLLITYNDLKAKELCEDLRLYDKNVMFYPSKDIIFFYADVHNNMLVRERMCVLKHLLEDEEVTVVASVDSGFDRVIPLSLIEKSVLHISETDTLNTNELSKQLVQLGYIKQGMTQAPGDFSVRGGIIDIYPLTQEVPVRIELFGDEVDSIRTFDVDSQRSIERITHTDIYPATEWLLSEDEISEGLRKLDAEAKKTEEALRAQMKNEEATRLKTNIRSFVENLTYCVQTAGMDSYIRFFREDTVSFFDYFDDTALIVLDEPLRITEKADVTMQEFTQSMENRLQKGYILPSQADAVFETKQLFAGFRNRKVLLLSTMEYKFALLPAKAKQVLTVRTMSSYNNQFELLAKDLQRYKKQGYRVILLSGSKTRAQHLAEDLREFEIPAFYSDREDRVLEAGEIMTTSGNLRHGFEYPMIRFVMITESDIFSAQETKKKKTKTYSGQKIGDFNDLSFGDYVVHENHGLGIYRGIEKIEVEKITKDYLKIEYGDGGVLYVPATGVDVIQKYASADADKKPKLNRLNSVEWKNTKARVKSAVASIAKDLVELYAKRQQRTGFAFGEDTVWQREFEEMFPYTETDDQLRAIEDTKRDMESTRIMDRLICGDVGYGKTEIAIRAAFKAAGDGKQVALLVPTTILAQQHYNTFVQRMKDYPVKVEMMSRFRTPAQQKKTIEGLQKGSVDIVIGTHRLLSQDIKFKSLGLLVVDEEQRFGVVHKEKIKKMKEDVDVLTLTATPIPRTLHMSLIGIRDMSVLDEAPVDRLPIQTFVMERDDEVIREAVSRELSRNGQVYYVYNRVQGIADVAARIAKLLPEANVVYAHGQMSERTLERIMYSFINGEIDVLVSTTIIETGLDIANVNTILIDNAEALGLSQLYQLRGRVGRSNRTAYAFLMYRRDKMLTETAEKRLQAIREFTELGSGIKIAMKDLEIRGAGNLLGAEQSGHMEAVGYDLYCKMLNSAVKSLKTGEEEASFETTMEFETDAYIPSDYIRNEAQKLEMYKRIADVSTEEERMDLQDELIDRFGDIPFPVESLLQAALIRTLCRSVYVTALTQKAEEVVLQFYTKAKLRNEKIPDFLKERAPRLKISVEGVPEFRYTLENIKKQVGTVLSKSQTESVFCQIKQLLADMKAVLVQPKEGNKE